MTEDKQETEQKPSRSARKREALALQVLGTELIKLKVDQLDQLPIQERLKKAILDHHRFRSREARRRQAQFIGRLMRDEDIQPIQNAIDDLNQVSGAAQYQLHQLEGWRTRLLSDTEALTHYLNDHPGTDVQKLRLLIRQSQQAEQLAELQAEQQNKPQAVRKAQRELFRFLRDNQADQKTQTGEKL